MSYAATLAASFLIQSSLCLVTTITVISRISLNFDQIRSQAVELAALEYLEISP